LSHNTRETSKRKWTTERRTTLRRSHPYVPWERSRAKQHQQSAGVDYCPPLTQSGLGRSIRCVVNGSASCLKPKLQHPKTTCVRIWHPGSTRGRRSCKRTLSRCAWELLAHPQCGSGRSAASHQPEL